MGTRSIRRDCGRVSFAALDIQSLSSLQATRESAHEPVAAAQKEQ